MDVSPNPFTEHLSVSFNLPEEMNATISIYELSGRLISTIAEGLYPAGSSTVEWVPTGELSSGYYLMRVETPGGCSVKSCVLLR